MMGTIYILYQYEVFNISRDQTFFWPGRVPGVGPSASLGCALHGGVYKYMYSIYKCIVCFESYDQIPQTSDDDAHDTDCFRPAGSRERPCDNVAVAWVSAQTDHAASSKDLVRSSPIES